jgi:hypothetical protein
MDWSVVRDDKVYTIICDRRWTAEMAREVGHRISHVDLVRTDYETREKERIRLGTVMHCFGVRATVPYWVAMYEACDWTGRYKHETVQGFATRRFAIEHMLRRLGWWPERD